MNLKQRLGIIALSFWPFLFASAVLFVLSQMDFLVEKDPIPFDGRNLRATYESEKGNLKILRKNDKSGYRVKGVFDSELLVNPKGEVVVHETSVYYTPFWIPLDNPVTTLNTHNPEFPLLDHSGVLGLPGEAYTARQEESFILWDKVLQSQASYRYGIFDAKDNRAATAVYDATCGLMFQLQVKAREKPNLRLVDTNFPISRNRVCLLILAPLATIALVYFFLYQARRKENFDAVLTLRDTAWFVALGSMCIMTDTLMDLWYPFALGRFAPVLWHILLIVPLFIVGRRACLPAVVELVMAFCLWFFLKGPAPTFAFIPGLTTAFIMALEKYKN